MEMAAHLATRPTPIPPDEAPRASCLGAGELTRMLLPATTATPIVLCAFFRTASPGRVGSGTGPIVGRRRGEGMSGTARRTRCGYGYSIQGPARVGAALPPEPRLRGYARSPRHRHRDLDCPPPLRGSSKARSILRPRPRCPAFLVSDKADLVAAHVTFPADALLEPVIPWMLVKSSTALLTSAPRATASIPSAGSAAEVPSPSAPTARASVDGSAASSRTRSSSSAILQRRRHPRILATSRHLQPPQAAPRNPFLFLFHSTAADTAWCRRVSRKIDWPPLPAPRALPSSPPPHPRRPPTCRAPSSSHRQRPKVLPSPPRPTSSRLPQDGAPAIGSPLPEPYSTTSSPPPPRLVPSPAHRTASAPPALRVSGRHSSHARVPTRRIFSRSALACPYRAPGWRWMRRSPPPSIGSTSTRDSISHKRECFLFLEKRPDSLQLLVLPALARRTPRRRSPHGACCARLRESLGQTDVGIRGSGRVGESVQYEPEVMR
ncbi:hypothetical protein B0H15DRAFT_957034 [Mycena belliarum]|uniref:Uncharacterized protein n=1 Tax=Mycena belliarum TaxID=1033014 RepID=A0AAD6XEP0_9AGAR|nr:hypothetical protein B0H15DRAFT_957034 [Mycena belliae]